MIWNALTGATSNNHRREILYLLSSLTVEITKLK
jgi:hypothetical protein